MSRRKPMAVRHSDTLGRLLRYADTIIGTLLTLVISVFFGYVFAIGWTL
ncbi:MAG: hypothetical protein ACPHQD_04830 [Vibrio toranzoniae]